MTSPLDRFTESIQSGHPVECGIKPLDGLEVYRLNYLFGLLQALKDHYPACYSLLGEENFRFFSARFIEENPSKSPNIDDYGAGFDDFLARQDELADHGYFYYLAKLDWFWYREDQEKISLPYGIFSLWNSAVNGFEFDDHVNEEVLETICIKKKDNEVYLTSEGEKT